MKIDFEFNTKYGVFKDALHFYDDVIPSDAEIEAMKQQRVNDWIAFVDAASNESTPVEEV